MPFESGKDLFPRTWCFFREAVTHCKVSMKVGYLSLLPVPGILCEREQVSRTVLGGEPVHLKSRYHARLLWPERTKASSPTYPDEAISSRVDAPSFTP
jgi:hypothetical protein